METARLMAGHILAHCDVNGDERVTMAEFLQGMLAMKYGAMPDSLDSTKAGPVCSTAQAGVALYTGRFQGRPLERQEVGNTLAMISTIGDVMSHVGYEGEQVGWDARSYPCPVFLVDYVF